MNTSKKVVFLSFIPSPYRVDFFNELHKKVDLFVIYYEKGVSNLGWKETKKLQQYRYLILFEKSRLIGIFNLMKLLIQERNSVIIIGGYAMLPEIVAILFLKIIGVKFIINSDGGFISKGFIKTLVKKVLIQSATYWLSSGVNTTNSLKYYGAQDRNIFEYPFTSLFKSEVLLKIPSKDEKVNLKKELFLNLDNNYIVFVGQLIQRKGIDVLIKAYCTTSLKNFNVLLIGEGESYEELQELVNAESRASEFIFLGKKNKEEVMKYLRLSEVFVLPSREDIWGLVINEAIANGLAVISTNKVGASYSLIKDGENGFVINCDNENELADAINKTLDTNIEGMQQKSLEIASNYTIENMVNAHLNLFHTFNANSRY